MVVQRWVPSEARFVQSKTDSQRVFRLTPLLLLWLITNLVFGLLISVSYWAVVLFGILQWLVLHTYLPRRRLIWWIPASNFGWSIGISFIYAGYGFSKQAIHSPISASGNLMANFLTHSPWSPRYLLAALFLSAAIGLLQSMVLQYSVHQATKWVYASAVGGLLREVMLRIAPSIAGIFMGWTIYSVITGITLVWLLRHPKAVLRVG